MKRLSVVAVIFTSLGLLLGFHLRGGAPAALAGGGGGVPACTSKSGDVNADGKTDLSDAMTILGHLFLGGPMELVPLCGAPLAASGLPDSGQTICFDQTGAEIPCDGETCPAQDGFNQTGCPSRGRFVDHGDGTVTDHCTGLMWQKETADDLPWCAALEYCEGLDFAVYDDWRLPDVRELQSIVDYGLSDPAIDPVFRAFSSPYWSSTTYAAYPNLAYAVYFYGGFVSGGDDKGTSNHVRAVRNAP